MTKWQYGVIAWLVICNGIALTESVYRVATWPDSATLHITADNLREYRDADTGASDYEVTVPLKKFPYELQLHQQYRFEMLGLALLNLVLVAAFIVSCRRAGSAAQESPTPQAN